MSINNLNMNILVTGAHGFIGKNLIAELKNRNFSEIYEYDITTGADLFDSYTKDCSFVVHLAGINRPKSEDEFMIGNFDFTSRLLSNLKKYNNPVPVLMTSSVQAELDNPYGKSKKAGEDVLIEYGKETGTSVFIYRLPNVFGKWCRPNYNSGVATFCNNIANDIPIKVNDPDVMMNLVYIDDVVEEIITRIETYDSEPSKNTFYSVEPVHSLKLGEIVDLIYSFKSSREYRFIPDMSDVVVKKLYSTYLSYLPTDRFKYPLMMNIDDRGSFTEFIKTTERGQVSVNISKPGITKGNHWHHSKCEKFLVVSGKGVIRFRKIDTTEVLEFHVDSDNLEVVDIPPGYTHNIENLGNSNMVTIMWANELLNPDKPDTFYLKV
jgi:UDP-2-acetamido-2,6-beta-L-arabino-hexul-4-ose reductase